MAVIELLRESKIEVLKYFHQNWAYLPFKSNVLQQLVIAGFKDHLMLEKVLFCFGYNFMV
jgi:hypothetical protein